MDVNGPGTSLFQGSEQLSFDVLRQREEEEEALKDQKRLNLELKNILENAFDDVSFDNDEHSHILQSNNHSMIQRNSLSPQQLKGKKGTGKANDSEEMHIRDLNTPLCHTNEVKTKFVNFNSENDNYADKYRTAHLNGSLHDVVDASGGGGGGDAPSIHHNHCYRTSPLAMNHNDMKTENMSNSDELKRWNQKYQEAEYNSIEQLQVLYEVRVREVHRLTELVDNMRNKHEVEKSELKRQITLSLAESERASMSQKQLQSLLVASKQQIDDLEREVETLKKNMNLLEESKEEMILELETARATVTDLQRKVTVLEKGNKGRSEAMQHELNLKILTEKHAAEQKQLYKELDSYKRNLDEKIKENDQLRYKVSEVSQSSEEHLAKKSEIINRLSKQIEETQEQCEKLMKSSTAEENIKLQMELKFMKEENEKLNFKLSNMEKNFALLENELKQYESLNKLSVFDTSQKDDTSQSKDSEFGELNSKLREELYRALNSQKAKRQEINNLHSMLKEKDEKLIIMTDKERRYLAEAAKFREETSRQISELKSFQEVSIVKTTETKKLQKLLEQTKTDLELKLQNAQVKCQDLEKAKVSLEMKIKDLEVMLEEERSKSASRSNEEFLRFHNEGLKRAREEMEESYKLDLLKKDMHIERLEKEVDDVKNLYVEVFNAKETLIKQMEKERSTSGRSSVDLDEVKRLQKELEKSRQRILELDQTVRQQYQQEVDKLNSDINHLELEIEKNKKEKEHCIADKEKYVTENELLKTEVEQMTSEKNLHFLNSERLTKEMEELKKELESLRIATSEEINEHAERHVRELQEVKNKYDIQIKKLNKEIELMVTKTVSTDSKYTSPMKNTRRFNRTVGTQRSPTVETKATSPLLKVSTQESCTSPIADIKKEVRRELIRSKDTSVLTDPEPKQFLKSEVFKMMQELGQRHEDEMEEMESKYKTELVRLEKRFQMEMDRCREAVKREVTHYYTDEIEKLEEKHRIEMENRIEQEKKEAVVGLITEWACEVQTLKHSHAEAQAEIQKIRAKYKTAKNVALQYKTYFKNKSEHMKDEWKRIEDRYEKALKELEKNVHVLVDVKEDEVKAKVESITKLYEQKINKMKDKLAKCENRLKEEGMKNGNGFAAARNSDDPKKYREFDLKKKAEELFLTDRYSEDKLKAPRLLSKKEIEERLYYKSDSSDKDRRNRKKKETEDWLSLKDELSSEPEKDPKTELLTRKEIDQLSQREDPMSDRDRTSR